MTGETRLALLKEGIPVMTCESDMADRRRFDEAKVYDPLDSFMENLGMTKL